MNPAALPFIYRLSEKPIDRTVITTKNRRPARVLALQALYEMDTTHHALEDVMKERLTENQIADDLRIFTYKLIQGVWDNRAQIDRMLQTFAPNWPLEQVAVIDRNLLRMAIYEFAIWRETPPKVAINEVVDLAKEYGSESASRFVNGVLGTFIAHETEGLTMLDGATTPTAEESTHAEPESTAPAGENTVQ